MPRLFSLFFFTLFATTLPFSAHAATADRYANAVDQFRYPDNHNPEDGIGAPDGVYVHFLHDGEEITYDMGEGEEGTGDLIVYELYKNFTPEYTIYFLDTNYSVIQKVEGQLSTETTQITIDYTGEVPYRFVTIEATDGEWHLDAIEAITTVASETEEEILVDDEEPVDEKETIEDTSSTQGMLLKLPDDHDPATTVDAAVYLVGLDGKRHAFPTESIFYSWFEDFSTLSYIDETHLAEYALGANVAIRPGTSLIKLTNDPKVYAVDDENTLHWIPSEELAATLYGTDWAMRVVDIPDVYFSSYTIGSAISSEHHPSGTFGYTPEGRVIYLRNATYYTIVDANLFRFNTNFYVPFSQEELDDYAEGGDLTEDLTVSWPF
jgi:hypothetical protein